jgi:dipeptidyl aminopeptidase/acylaminoacyl peptidase
MKACYYNDYPLLKKTAKEMVSSYTGATPSEDPALYAFVSPINYVTKNSPPTCVFVGEHDAAVAPTQSYRLVKKLDKAGVADKLVSVPYANHLCDMGGKNFAGQGWMNITFKWFEEYE